MDTGPSILPETISVRPRARIDRGRAWRVALLFGLGGLLGFLVVPGRSAERAPAIVLEGQAVSLEGDEAHTRESIAAIARGFIRGRVTLRAAGAGDHVRTREELGAQVDAARVVSLAREARDEGSALRRAYRAHHGKSEPLRLALPVRVDGPRAIAALLPIKDELDRDAMNARIDVTSGKPVAEEKGREVDVYATLARLDQAIAKGSSDVEIASETLSAGHTMADLDGAKVDVVLGAFETKLLGDPKRDLRLPRAAAAKVTGVVVLPGETFDFNDVVGGVRAADAAEGTSSGSSGAGGESQIASTLHAAAFFAGLEIVERHARTRPSFSIPMGFDALVVHPTVTLRIKNTTSRPVMLVETVNDGIVRAEIRGAEPGSEVTFARRIDKVTPFTEREIPDPKAPRGSRLLAQRGIPGFAITRDRIVRDGAVAVRERSHDRYPATPQIWRIGTGEPDPKFKGHEDAHPELLADEYMTMTEGPDSVSPLSPQETHVKGRYGVPGWTVREGFTKPLGARFDKRDEAGD